MSGARAGEQQRFAREGAARRESEREYQFSNTTLFADVMELRIGERARLILTACAAARLPLFRIQLMAGSLRPREGTTCGT